ncbi:Minichromosome maintenance Mcm10 [Carpediemonas membranifera]|uniref:Protein MCM10 homolog n=1 Tax=Carpediemonas membranifera TaxID=201153 RepID=A0A8J6AZW7_9EUKA|nr:Minichromosome maintenance Mcm10 [Carpediemonas membranifera]|eukprot:KAG9389924.1 Minichromosome maintenance Mcm10 [Carpediemonas membranifera]
MDDDFEFSDDEGLNPPRRLDKNDDSKESKASSRPRNHQATFCATNIRAQTTQPTRTMTHEERVHAPEESFSGLKIVSRTVIPSMFETDVKGMRFIPLSRLAAESFKVQGRLTPGDSFELPSTFVIGIVHNRMVRTSGTGRQFTVFTLTNFRYDVKAFAFGKAHDACSKFIQNGAIISFMHPSCRVETATEVSISSADPSCLLRLGLSANYGMCLAKKKNGSPCTQYVDLIHTDLCAYHDPKKGKGTRINRASTMTSETAMLINAKNKRAAPTKGPLSHLFFMDASGKKAQLPLSAASSRRKTIVSREEKIAQSRPKPTEPGIARAAQMLSTVKNGQTGSLDAAERRKMLIELRRAGLATQSTTPGSQLKRLGRSPGNTDKAAGTKLVVKKMTNLFSAEAREQEQLSAQEKLDALAHELIAKEKLAEATVVEVTVWRCDTCHKTTVKYPKTCSEEGHHLIKSKATKKFFRCSECGARRAIVGQAAPLAICGCGARGAWVRDNVAGVKV